MIMATVTLGRLATSNRMRLDEVVCLFDWFSAAMNSTQIRR